MEKRASTIICRLGVVLTVLGLAAIAAHANSLLNPGFETLGSNATTAANWNQFNNAGVSATNANLFPITAHSGVNSMQTQAPGNTNFDASGAYQDVSASPNQNWRLTGYCLNWQNSEMIGPGTFAAAQLAFLDLTNAIIQTVDSPHFGTDAAFPLDRWSPFEIDATAPANTAKVRTYVLYVGDSADHGSAFFDDLNLFNPVGGSNASTVVVKPAVQISWPTSASITNQTINYQIQSTTNLVFTNAPSVNVLSNGGFEIGAVSGAVNNATVAGWALQGGGGTTISSKPHPTRSGLGALRLVDSANNVPVVDQGGPFNVVPHPVTPGQVWDLQGYGYVSSAEQPLTGSAFGVIKIVWNDSLGTLIQPLSAVNDPALIGTAATGGNGGIECQHMTASSTVDTWTFLEARGTVPPGAAFAIVYEILVGQNSGGAVIRFDDITFAQPTTTFGWANLGPVFPGTGNTNNLSDLTNTNKQNFYRVTTP